MHVRDDVAEISGIEARAVSIASPEYVILPLVSSLDKERHAAQQRLHEVRERIGALDDDHVQVIRHHGECAESDCSQLRCRVDALNDFLLHAGQQSLAILQTRNQVVRDSRLART